MAAIEHMFHIAASKQEVFKAISTIDGLQQWWTKTTSGGENIGEIMHFQFGDNGFIKFKVTAIDSPNYLEWKCTDAHPEWIGTKANFTLTEVDGKTKVYFKHSGWAEQTEFFAHCNFSWGRYFVSLRSLLEKGIGEPFLP